MPKETMKSSQKTDQNTRQSCDCSENSGLAGLTFGFSSEEIETYQMQSHV
jgi:hypothetical protein